MSDISYNMRRIMLAIAGAGAVVAAAVITTPASAQGDLLVAPTRVILDGNRGTEVILSNIGQEEATYRIGLELRRMSPDGNLEDVELAEANDKEKAALEMIRYAPRRITLPPGQPQAVRVAARPGADLPDGEYRVHMSFRAIPKPREATETAGEAEGLSVRITPIYGVTIPIMVRNGRIEAQAALEQPRIVQTSNGPRLAVRINRQGESSTYGELRVLSQNGGQLLYSIAGLAIYPEIDGRDFMLPLSAEQAASLRGPLRFEYREMPAAGSALIAAIDTDLG
ncbi:MAG: molecular chaperone [Sphingomonadaceae bacterium]